MTGEVKLLLALYNQAKRDLLAGALAAPKATRRRRRVQQDTIEWINGAEAPITFEFCCLHLERDPARERKRLLALIGGDYEKQTALRGR